MDGNIKILNNIYKNADLSAEIIDNILEHHLDKKMNEELQRELDEYEIIKEEAGMKLEEVGGEYKEESKLSKMETIFAVKMSSLKEDRISRVAEMMIQGTNMGIIDVTRKLNKYDNRTKDVEKLAERLIKLGEESIENLKEYL